MRGESEIFFFHTTQGVIDKEQYDITGDMNIDSKCFLLDDKTGVHVPRNKE